MLRFLVAIWALALAVPALGQDMHGPARALFAAAKADLARGDGIAAEAHLRQALDRGASREAVAARMGEALIDQNDLLKAREWLGQGRFAPADAVHGWRMLGLLERREGKLPAAARAYDRALTIAPESAPLWVDIGRLRYIGGEQVQAIEAVDRALAFDPQDVRALEFRGQLVRDQFGLVAALPWFERALKLASEDVSVLGEYAATLGELGRAKEMLVITRRMLEIEPGNPRAYFLQAVLAARAGKPELARALMNRTKGKLRNMPAAILLEGALDFMVGNTAQAIEALDRLVRMQPGNERARLLLAAAMMDAGQYRGVIQTFADASARGDAPVYLLMQVGRAHELLGDRAAAAPLLDRAARLTDRPIHPILQEEPLGVLAARWRDSSTAATGVPYIRKLLDSGALAEAESVAERLRAAYPGSHAANSLAGDVQLVRLQAAAAVQRYEWAARVRLDEGLLMRLTDGYGQSGRAAEAFPAIEGYLAGHPQSRTAIRLAASLAGLQGDWERARLLLEHLIVTGDERDAHLLADLAFARMKAGDDAAAIAAAERAYALHRASGITAQALGTVLAKSGKDSDRAGALLKKARAIIGDNALLREARGLLAKS